MYPCDCPFQRRRRARTDLDRGPDDGPRFKLVLAAGTPRGETDPARLEAWRHGVVGVTTAAVARGGTVVVPANVELASLVCTASLRWAPVGPGPVSHQDAAVQIIESGGFDPVARDLLGPHVHRGVAALFSDDRVPIAPDEIPPVDEEISSDPLEALHHPLATPPADDETVVGGFVIHPDDELEHEIETARHRLELKTIGGSDDGWIRGQLGLSERYVTGGSLPLGVLAELVIDDWLERRRGEPTSGRPDGGEPDRRPHEH